MPTSTHILPLPFLFRPSIASQTLGVAMPYLHPAPGPQAHPVPQDARTIHSSGQSFEQLRQDCLQAGTLFEDTDFPASNASLFFSERPQIPFIWKRPGVSEQGRWDVGLAFRERVESPVEEGMRGAGWLYGCHRGRSAPAIKDLQYGGGGVQVTGSPTLDHRVSGCTPSSAAA